MQADLYNISGEKEKKISLPKEIFGGEINFPLLSQAVRVYLANQRRARPQAKTRAEVKGSNRKIYRQKGTGGARHGDRKAPIFVGGGKAHPPRGVLKRLKLPKKIKRKALLAALAYKAKEKGIVFLSDLKKLPPKTKKAAVLLNKMGLGQKKTLMVLGVSEEKFFLPFRNLPGVEKEAAMRLHATEVLRNERLLFTLEGWKELKKRLKN